MPVGWAHGNVPLEVALPVPGLPGLVPLLEKLNSGAPEPFCRYVRDRLDSVASPFEASMIAEDLETIAA